VVSVVVLVSCQAGPCSFTVTTMKPVLFDHDRGGGLDHGGLALAASVPKALAASAITRTLSFMVPPANGTPANNAPCRRCSKFP